VAGGYRGGGTQMTLRIVRIAQCAQSLLRVAARPHYGSSNPVRASSLAAALLQSLRSPTN